MLCRCSVQSHRGWRSELGFLRPGDCSYQLQVSRHAQVQRRRHERRLQRSRARTAAATAAADSAGNGVVDAAASLADPHQSESPVADVDTGHDVPDTEPVSVAGAEAAAGVAKATGTTAPPAAAATATATATAAGAADGSAAVDDVRVSVADGDAATPRTRAGFASKSLKSLRSRVSRAAAVVQDVLLDDTTVRRRLLWASRAVCIGLLLLYTGVAQRFESDLSPLKFVGIVSVFVLIVSSLDYSDVLSYSDTHAHSA